MPTRRRRRSRPTVPRPHTSAGTALLRGRRPAEALRHYDVALRLAPRDEAALLGRAQALTELGRRPEAADAFDALAEVRAADGMLADAVDAARRGLELAEGRDRRRTLERLIARLRASEPGEPGRLALERALLVLEGPAMTATPPPADAGVRGRAESIRSPSALPEAPRRLTATRPPAAASALDRDLPPDASLEELRLASPRPPWTKHPAEAVERLLDLAAADLPAGSRQCRHGRLLRGALARPGPRGPPPRPRAAVRASRAGPRWPRRSSTCWTGWCPWARTPEEADGRGRREGRAP